MYICKYCGKEFESGKQLGGHVVFCEKNPKRRQALDKLADKKPKKQIYQVRCCVCEKIFQVEIFPSEYMRGSYRKTCSNECSHKLTSKNTDFNSKNKKIQKSLIGREHPEKRKVRYCACCSNIIPFERKESKYCSDECMEKTRHKKLSKSAHMRKLGGLNPDSTHKNYKRGYYKGVWCDSSWELAYLIYMSDRGIEVKRNYEPKQYVFENETYNFYPDFIVEGKLYEIKGFYTPKNKAKKEQVTDVVFLDRKDMKPIIEYVVSKYGKDYTSLYTRV